MQPAGVKLPTTRSARLIAMGEKLWNDPKLSSNGLACATCHAGLYGQMNTSFGQPYPHHVAMPAQMAGVDKVNAAEMVNFCMITPMANKPLAWDSQELLALTAYVQNIQPGYRHVAAAGGPNPCNPCGMKHNPCNPCGMKRP